MKQLVVFITLLPFVISPVYAGSDRVIFQDGKRIDASESEQELWKDSCDRGGAIPYWCRD